MRVRKEQPERKTRNPFPFPRAGKRAAAELGSGVRSPPPVVHRVRVEKLRFHTQGPVHIWEESEFRGVVMSVQKANT